MDALRHLAAACVITAGASLHAQTAPVPLSLQDPVYPAIAKAAHVHGDVVANFSIDSDGHTSAVQIVSGQPMLRGAVTTAMALWRFRTPLPLGAETSFVATLHFGDESADGPDSLDFPPSFPCCGNPALWDDTVSVRISDLGGTQHIVPVVPPPAPPGPWCKDDTNIEPPTSTAATDFVELSRIDCDEGCADYDVRVYRDGRIEWTGLRFTAVLGPSQASMPAADAEALLARFARPSFWLRCTYQPPEPLANPDPLDPDAIVTENYVKIAIHLTASLAGRMKTIDATPSDMANDYGGQRLAWAIDRAANTHQWRHPDAAAEPLRNMPDDIRLPKVGVTLLMRAIYRLEHDLPRVGDAERLDPIERLLADEGNPNAADESGWTALMYLAWLRPSDAAVTRLLLAANANPDQRSRHGDTALLIAARNGYLDPLLLAAHAGINAANVDGATPLMYLAGFTDPEPLRNALVVGADPTARDNLGHTALDYLANAACVVSFNRPKPVPCPPLNAAYAANRAALLQAMQNWRPR